MLKSIAIRKINKIEPPKSFDDKVVAKIQSDIFKDVLNQTDLIHFEAVLVSEGINDNDDAFIHDELVKASKSPVLKPINWQHNDSEILGVIYCVEARDLEGKALAEVNSEPFEIAIKGALWHFLPHVENRKEEIEAKLSQDNLFVSMECWYTGFDYAFYTNAGNLFDVVNRNDETSYLDKYLRVKGGAGKYSGMRIGRALRGITFGGMGLVDQPANKRSVILNHFLFEEENTADNVVSETTLEVKMTNLEKVAASQAPDVEGVVQKALDQRAKAEAAAKLEKDFADAKAKVASLEATHQKVIGALEKTYLAARAAVPSEIAKIDQALNSLNGDDVWAAKLAWIVDSLKATASVSNSQDKLVDENKKLKAELDKIKAAARKAQIEYLFATVLKMEKDEVETLTKIGMSQSTDEAFEAWMDEKKLFAKKLLKNDAGALEFVDTQAPSNIDGAVLDSRLGKVPSAVPPAKNKLTGSLNLDELFDEVKEPNLAVNSDNSKALSPMGKLVAGLFPSKEKKD